MKTRFDSLEPAGKPEWCPGCGDFGVLAAMRKALSELELEPENVVVVSGVGNASKLPQWVNAYGFHTLHGRPVPVATGIKLANHELEVIVVGGDGDFYGEGTNHLMHAARRNIDIACIACDNQVYALTTGQASPTSEKGFATKSTPHGAIAEPVNPLALALASGATFVARGYAGRQAHLVNLIKEAVKHEGFALVDVLQPCVTFNKLNTYEWFNARVYELESTYQDKAEAFKKAFEWGDRIPIGIFYREKRASYHRQLAHLKEPLAKMNINNIDVSELFKSFM